MPNDAESCSRSDKAAVFTAYRVQLERIVKVSSAEIATSTALISQCTALVNEAKLRMVSAEELIRAIDEEMQESDHVVGTDVEDDDIGW